MLRRVVRAVLSRPVAVTGRAALRNAVWRIRGLALRNPPAPSHVDSVLFVCLGNICRSPFAALLAEKLLAEAGRGYVRCASAGIRPSQAGRSPEEACRAAETHGLCLANHTPQALTRELVAAHDMVFVMEAAQFARLRADYPQFRDRVFLLPLFAGRELGAFERCNIVDPFGQPVTAFAACYERIEACLRQWVATLPRH